MKRKGKIQIKLLGLTDSITRYPLTSVFLLALTLTIISAIEDTQGDYSKLIATFLVGTFLSISVQAIFERFLRKASYRMILMGVAIVLSLGYYIIISPLSKLTLVVIIRTIVAVFALVIIFIWVPSIKSKISFNESFMAVFKSFFIALFFSGVIFTGVSLILAATDVLIISLDEKLYMHAANLIFAMFAPLYFLSMIPIYPGRSQEENEEEEFIKKATTSNKFLETLISYVIIPITAVFTVILLLYIIMNITGDFWTDNLMEPMLVSYSITVIFVYLLAAKLDNAFAKYFRRIFPKVLVPVVLFQTISSVIKIGDLGITYGRYYVIMFGIFATTAGILFCLIPVHKNGMIAPILIALAIISILPPVDAFTISRSNQTSRLKNALTRNNMLEDNTIKPNASVSEKDREIIVASTNYLFNTNNTDGIEWLASYNVNRDFEGTFGFTEYGQVDYKYKSFYASRELSPIPVDGYDYMVHSNINSGAIDNGSSTFEKNGMTYTLNETIEGDNRSIVLWDENQKEIIRIAVQDIFSRFEGRVSEKNSITTEEATYTQENDLAVLSYVIENVNISEWVGGDNRYAEGYLLIRIK